MKLLTVRAAAEQLGIGYSTLKHWIYQGSVRTTQTTGGHHRVAEAEIERLLARRDPRVSPGAQSSTGSRSSKGSRGSREGEREPATSGLIVALSGRNRLRGFVEEVRTDGLLGQIRLRIGGQTLTAVITGDAVAELKLRRGDDAVAIIKSTDVMIARETSQPARAPSGKRRA